ncbi:MAG TPA: Rieske 2Fe-2S domain-containing protein [Burkholderiales bacterium]|jgi:anthranilate 1,2-dioxygenase large subunit/terephthalate 1,2-dioxygenase oxygenase component alpha subunit|nr:Rieske 2Fe-2S domain-containing protein [Burkholderiales bacterium]
MEAAAKTWPAEGLTRVPYWVYQDEEIYRREQQRIFRGPTWSYLCLEAELPEPESYLTTFVGDMPVVVTRDAKGVLHAFENRCAHRGALICMKSRGKAPRLTCVYHNWTYDHAGNLTSVAFRRGIGGEGGMPADAKPESQAPQKLRVEAFCGLVFGTLSPRTPPLLDYIGPEIVPRLRRVMRKPVKVLGGYTQVLRNNWKLYMDNVKDTYHASLLHLFFTRFRINRLTQRGGVFVSADGAHHTTFTLMDQEDSTDAYERDGMRSAGGDGGFRLEAPEILEQVDELGDGVAIQILSLFPGFVLHQIRNSLAARQVVPKGVGRTELHWTLFGFADDDEAMTRRRLLQANLVGPAGYISLEDGAATGFVQRGVAAAADRASVIEMGGSAIGSQDSRITETAVRGLWQAWRRHMEI